MAVPKLPGQPVLKSLSARLLLLTIGFVMLGEVLIYAPSVARFRKTYLEERIASAQLATLALEALPARSLSAELRRKLLANSDAYNIVLRLPKRSIFVLGPGKMPSVEETFDLRKPIFFGWFTDAVRTMIRGDNRVIRVVGQSPRNEKITIEVLIDEKPLRTELLAFSWRILGLSIVISVITAGLVFLSLQWLLVRPMRRITESMMAFRANPLDDEASVAPTNRGDEIGIAQRELGVMQKELRLALQQRRRLAALGAAVAKINHDLRNTLSVAMLASDRLSNSDDPDVKRMLPKIFGAMDRAVELCSQTLNFARQGSPELAPSGFSLYDLVDEVGSAITLSDLAGDSAIAWDNRVDRELIIEADRELLFRAIDNISRNAFEAGADQVAVDVVFKNERICISIIDNGPGLPKVARENLFTPFLGSARKGGTGLGLVIVRDIMRAHGGDINLMKSDGDGTTFCLELPENIKEGSRLPV